MGFLAKIQFLTSVKWAEALAFLFGFTNREFQKTFQRGVGVF
jgi:hypothetical protein